MPGASHFYVTMHGTYTLGHWVGETGQMGFRFAPLPKQRSESPIQNLPNNISVVPTFVERDETNFTVAQTFDVDLPGWIGPGTDWATVSDDVANDVLTFLGAIKAHQSDKFWWTHIKIAPIEYGTGAYLAPATVYTLKNLPRGTGTGMLPPEVSIALSTRTAIVGKRGRGRMYLPAPASSTSENDGTVLAAQATAMVNEYRTLIQAIKNLPGIDQYDPEWLICSAASTTAVLPLEARIGHHYDAQRRRQHQVEETYSTLAIA